MALAQDEGLASLTLGMERVELLLEPLVGGFAGIDGAAEAPGSPVTLLSHLAGASFKGRFRPKKAQPFQ